MIYLLDTNTCIAYINRRNLSVRERLNALSPLDVALCDVVKYELYYGAYRSSRQQENLATLREFLVSLSVYLLTVKRRRFVVTFGLL
ncbi:PIN domain-containing protein [Chroococcus sp. FPU101]|uniref:PIN domain-containing protein n=1 Tax=Chroococcus sp. FPU101 TaxID=1974212 RepID=UPI001AA94F04|nr:PIN domain-containing protein [Chroococcus sp. FPU101]GFE69372.1 hypothetical protein CFPU101_19820 [Chroococcus sp. FPU101]